MGSEQPETTDFERPSGLPTGVELLRDPSLNKGTAFTEEERDALGLRGLLPPRACGVEEQTVRVLTNFRGKPTDLEKYIYLTSLQDRNETLFYRVLLDHLEEMMPIVYTPTVGRACQDYGHIYRRSRGLYISANHRGRVREVLKNWPERSVRVIVVTDGERILGLGDLGANGMGIPVGKLALYTACAGVPPSQCLPVMIDVGTENAELLQDPLYLGLIQRRLRGWDYDDLVDEFIQASQELYPGVLVQFEDFANANAFRLLKRYREAICTFDDDIQGTGAVALAGLYSALRITGGSLADQRMLFLGAGEAGIGIADQIVSAMVAEGLSQQVARRKCWFVDSKGLVVRGRPGLAEHKVPYAHGHGPCPNFLSAIGALRPTAVIGVSGQRGAFSAVALNTLARLNERPVVFALSNPTSKAECTASEAYEHTSGRAIFASGSPFGPVSYKGETFVPGQGNNAYIFPGVGLGVVSCGATRVTDEMFLEAAKALALQVTEEDLQVGRLYPALSRIRGVSAAIAVAVAKVAYSRGLATVPPPEDLPAHVRAQMYRPEYRSYV